MTTRERAIIAFNNFSTKESIKNYNFQYHILQNLIDTRHSLQTTRKFTAWQKIIRYFNKPKSPFFITKIPKTKCIEIKQPHYSRGSKKILAIKYRIVNRHYFTLQLLKFISNAKSQIKQYIRRRNAIAIINKNS